MLRPRAIWTGLLTLFLVPETVAAHEIGGAQFESPIPLQYLLVGAAVTVGVTALWLGWSGRPPADRWTPSLGTISTQTFGAVRTTGVLIFSVGVVNALLAGFFGPEAAAENFAAAFVWGLWIKGIGLVAIVAGSPWSALSPWNNLHRALSWLEGEQLSWTQYPTRFGVWPAVAGFVLVVGIAENLLGLSQRPKLTVGLVALYAALMLLGAVGTGASWFERADFLSVLYRTFGRVAPVAVERVDAGVQVSVRPPWRGCTRPVDRPGMVSFIVAVVYTVSFDGFTSTPGFQTLLFSARNSLGTGTATTLLLYLLGLLIFLAVFFITATLSDAFGGESKGPAQAFAPTVIPIAAAYEFAHYYPFVAGTASRTIEMVGSLFGIPMDVSVLGWLSIPAFWASQLALIVGGHVIAVVAAHGVALDRYRTKSAARRGHLPLVVLMIGYTVLSLWIVSRPVVSG
ncbi:MAG: hypothetical protein V5A56_05335 [Halolamina sp.]